MKYTVDQIELTEDQARRVAEQYAGGALPIHLIKAAKIRPLGYLREINETSLVIEPNNDGVRFRFADREIVTSMTFRARHCRELARRLNAIADILDE